MSIEVSITGVGSELQGVGRAADGRTLFVRGALPGERVLARVVREAERYLVAEVERVIEPAPGRAAPRCPYYDRCGGCAAQHMDYALSLTLKQRRVRDALERIGGVEGALVLETIPSPEIWRYRNKAEYASAVEHGRPIFGTSGRASHRVVEVCDCLLQHEASVRFLGAAREILPESAQLVTRVNADGQMMGILCQQRPVQGLERALDALFERLPGLVSLHSCQMKSRAAHALDGTVRLIRGSERLPERLAGFDYGLSPHSFFQVNRAQAETLVAEMLKAAKLTGNETVVDAYCGIGTLTLPIARAAKRAIGIEIVPPAIEDAKRAAQQNGMQSAESACGDASVVLGKLLRGGLRPDVLVVDPPRKGVDAKLIGQVLQARPARIAYVSCDPGTLARDIKLLSGVYRLEYAQPLDMFPWTEHVECVALMSEK